MERASLPSFDNLTHLGLRPGVDMRPTLIRVLTDLYVQKLAHTPDEERHYTELALRLLDSVDIATRTAVADRLVRHLSPPRRVIQYLAADLPSHAVARLAREPEAPPRPAIPVETHEPGNPAPDPAAGGDETIARTEEAPSANSSSAITPDIASELNELFFAADADERRLILLNLEIAVPMPAGEIALVRGGSIGQQLENAALSRNREDFAQHLARVLHISRAQARRIVGDQLGEPIVAAAKALALPRDMVYRILLFANTTVGHSVTRVHALASLYDEMSLQAAEHMVAIWQALQRSDRAAARHQPVTWNDDARARARTATTAVRRAPNTQRPTERRSVS